MLDPDDNTRRVDIDNLLSRLHDQLPIYARMLAVAPSTHPQLVRTTRSAWENEGKPFERYEWERNVPHITMLNDPLNRGITLTEGAWEHGLYELLATHTEARKLAREGDASRSLTSTPTPDANKARVKMSLADYQRNPRKATEDTGKLKDLRRGDLEKKKVKGHVQALREDTSRKETTARNSRLAEKYEGERSGAIKKARNEADKMVEDKKRRLEEERIEREEKEESKRALRQLNEMIKRKEADKLRAQEIVPVGMPAKARKLTASTNNARSKDSTSTDSMNKMRAQKKTDRPTKKLPPMLSPLPVELAEDDDVEMQDILDDRFYNFPPILSPLLPDVVEEAFLRLQGGDSSVKKDSVCTVPEGSLSTQDQLFASKELVKKSTKIDGDARTNVTRGNTKERLITRLCYGRRNAKNVEALLKLKPKPKQTSKPNHASTTSTDNTVVVDTKTASDERKPVAVKRPALKPVDSIKRPEVLKGEGKQVDARKRPRDAENPADPTSNKKLKAPAQTSSGPPISLSMASSRPLSNSPVPALKATSKLSRTPSKQDQPHEDIPNIRKNTVATAKENTSKTSQSIGLAAMAQSVGSIQSSSASSQQLQREHQRLQQLGTELKRDMDKLLKSKERDASPVSERDSKLGALIGVESSITYMLSYDKLTHLRRGQSLSHCIQLWLGLLGMVRYVVARSKPYPELYSCSLLNVWVIHDILELLYSESHSQNLTDNQTLMDDMFTNTRAKRAAWDAYVETTISETPGCFVPVLTSIFYGNQTVITAYGHIVEALEKFSAKEDLEWVQKEMREGDVNGVI